MRVHKATRYEVLSGAPAGAVAWKSGAVSKAVRLGVRALMPAVGLRESGEILKRLGFDGIERLRIELARQLGAGFVIEVPVSAGACRQL